MVLSQFCTLTTVSDTSTTTPLAIVEGTTIQSPTRSISLLESCMPATNPSIESLKISIRAAAKAPSPPRRAIGDLLMSIDMQIMVIIIHTIPFATFITPLRG